jgi:hypothetical protein
MIALFGNQKNNITSTQEIKAARSFQYRPEKQKNKHWTRKERGNKLPRANCSLNCTWKKTASLLRRDLFILIIYNMAVQFSAVCQFTSSGALQWLHLTCNSHRRSQVLLQETWDSHIVRKAVRIWNVAFQERVLEVMFQNRRERGRPAK